MMMLQKQDDIVGELRFLRDDFREFMRREIDYLKSEIVELKVAIKRIEEKLTSAI